MGGNQSEERWLKGSRRVVKQLVSDEGQMHKDPVRPEDSFDL